MIVGLTLAVCCVSCDSPELAHVTEARAWLADKSVLEGITGPGTSDELRESVRFDVWITRGREIPHIRETLEGWLLESNPHVDLRTAAWALSELGDERSIPALAKQARMGNRFAVISIGEIGGEEASDVLYDVLYDGLNVNARAAAVEALAKSASDADVLCVSLDRVASSAEFLADVSRRHLAKLDCTETEQKGTHEVATPFATFVYQWLPHDADSWQSFQVVSRAGAAQVQAWIADHAPALRRAEQMESHLAWRPLDVLVEVRRDGTSQKYYLLRRYPIDARQPVATREYAVNISDEEINALRAIFVEHGVASERDFVDSADGG